jgi:hypothetical protein
MFTSVSERRKLRVVGDQEPALDADGRVQDRLNNLIHVPGIMIMASPDTLQRWLQSMRPEAPTEYDVLHEAARHQVLKHLSGLLRQRHGRHLLDCLEQLDKDAPPGQVSQLGLAYLGPDFDAACGAGAQFLKDRAFADPAVVPQEAYEWAVRALVTAVRHELAYHRKVRGKVDVTTDMSKLWKLWLPH